MAEAGYPKAPVTLARGIRSKATNLNQPKAKISPLDPHPFGGSE